MDGGRGMTSKTLRISGRAKLNFFTESQIRPCENDVLQLSSCTTICKQRNSCIKSLEIVRLPLSYPLFVYLPLSHPHRPPFPPILSLCRNTQLMHNPCLLVLSAHLCSFGTNGFIFEYSLQDCYKTWNWKEVRLKYRKMWYFGSPVQPSSATCNSFSSGLLLAPLFVEMDYKHLTNNSVKHSIGHIHKQRGRLIWFGQKRYMFLCSKVHIACCAFWVHSEFPTRSLSTIGLKNVHG